ncbi:unnamed protein product [Onchocerca flexuosa]|uniref:Pentatricopeptide repeat-containing protein n=1 Tax=Onchocerca flexuosa TaxID=387005 RepID=A0A183HCK9_9BILA|nr:unnamed protein product [Onchocerca flexuosa]
MPYRTHYSVPCYTGIDNNDNHYPVSSSDMSSLKINAMPIMQINFRLANSLLISKVCNFFVVIYMEKGQPEEEYDLVERAIRKTGCWKEHLACAECMGETRDWRECKDESLLYISFLISLLRQYRRILIIVALSCELG